MAETVQFNTAWLVRLTNPHHDGTTQQIDDFVQAYQTDNARFLAAAQQLHQCRQTEDDVWLKAQRDPAVKRLEAADKQQDAYAGAAHYIIMGHALLPDDEPTKAEATECRQVFLDYSFSTNDAYGAESDKIIQMQQNLQQHQAFLQQIGAWPFYLKAVEKAQLVRQILGERALTKAEFVKGEMKTARQATDQAIAALYRVITAMQELMPSDALTALCNQLKGIELYARQYYLKDGSASGGGAGSSSSAEGSTTGGEDPDLGKD